MKNTSSGPEEGFFKKKGFFIALYSTLGAVMVLALVITFTNLTTAPGNNELAAMPSAEAEQGDSQSVDASDVESYEITKNEQEESDETAWWRSAPKATQTPAPSDQPAPAAPVTPPPVSPPAVSPPASETPVASDTPAASEAPAVPSTPTTDAETSSDAAEAEADNPSAETEIAAFTPFSETDKLIWPVAGEIAMDFSSDKLLYDPTLDQYRTNDDLRISAKEGTPVKTCAEGQVLEVGNNHVYGNYVSIDHGNGYVSTYGQLMEGVLVDEGEVVDAGQVIGGVGKPSYFGSLNGSHMNLRLTKEDEPVDPKIYLGEAE